MKKYGGNLNDIDVIENQAKNYHKTWALRPWNCAWIWKPKLDSLWWHRQHANQLPKFLAQIDDHACCHTSFFTMMGLFLTQKAQESALHQLTEVGLHQKHQRLAFIRNIKRKLDDGKSLKHAWKDLNITMKQYYEWSSSMEKMHSHKPRARSLSTGGQTSILQTIEQDLPSHTFTQREQGMAVNINIIAIKAATLSY